MFEDSYLDSFMESHIGNWTGDEDRHYAENEWHWTGDPNQDEDSLMEYAREQEEIDDSPCDRWDDPDGENIIGGNEPEDDPYASEWRDNEDYCDHY
jgi:hypothetical protein